MVEYTGGDDKETVQYNNILKVLGLTKTKKNTAKGKWKYIK